MPELNTLYFIQNQPCFQYNYITFKQAQAMFPQIKSNHSTKSQEVKHQPQYSISSRRDSINYSQGKQQNLLKLPILGGPNQEYYQRQIEKAQKQIQKINLEQKKLQEVIESYEEQFDRMNLKQKEINVTITSTQVEKKKITDQLDKIQGQERNEQNTILKQRLIYELKSIKQQISNLESAKNRVEFKFSHKKRKFNQLKSRINDLSIQSTSLFKYLSKLQNNKRMGPHWANMK